MVSKLTDAQENDIEDMILGDKLNDLLPKAKLWEGPAHQ